MGAHTPDVVRDPLRPALRQPFSPARVAGGFVFVSGQARVDENARYLAGTLEEEITDSIAAVARLLGEAGCTLADIVQTRCYVGDPDDLAEFNEIYLRHFSEPLPARTTLLGCLGSMRFEIDVVAMLPTGRVRGELGASA
jgi:2-iminobutanoate/2-iminopropanoate deaminase